MMDVGLKLWIFLLGGVAIVGMGWLLWSRIVGFPSDDPTASRPRHEGDGSAIDMSPHDRDGHHF
jgi:hypothetical protein